MAKDIRSYEHIVREDDLSCRSERGMAAFPTAFGAERNVTSEMMWKKQKF